MTSQDFIFWLYKNERYRRRALPANWFVIMVMVGVYAVFVPHWVDSAVDKAITEAIYPYLPLPLFQQYSSFQYRFPESAFALMIDLSFVPLTVLFLVSVMTPTFRKILRDQRGKSPGRDEFLKVSITFLVISLVVGLFLLFGHRFVQKSALLMLWPERGIYVFLFILSTSFAFSGFAALLTTAQPQFKPRASSRTKWKFLHRYDGGAVTGLVRFVDSSAKGRCFQLSRFDARNTDDLQLWLSHDLRALDDVVPDQFLGFVDKDQSQQDIPVMAGINPGDYRYVIIRQEGQIQPLAYAGLWRWCPRRTVNPVLPRPQK